MNPSPAPCNIFSPRLWTWPPSSAPRTAQSTGPDRGHMVWACPAAPGREGRVLVGAASLLSPGRSWAASNLSFLPGTRAWCGETHITPPPTPAPGQGHNRTTRQPAWPPGPLSQAAHTWPALHPTFSLTELQEAVHAAELAAKPDPRPPSRGPCVTARPGPLASLPAPRTRRPGVHVPCLNPHRAFACPSVHGEATRSR